MRRGVELLERPSGRAGTHICWGFKDFEAYRTAASAFLAEGLQRGERIFYLADAPEDELLGHLEGIDAERLAEAGDLVVRPVRSLLGPDGSFDGPAQVQAYQSLVDSALADGYAGLRAVADASALSAADPKGFAAYELMADRFIANASMAGMCAFSADTPGLADLFAVHPSRSAGCSNTPASAWFEGRTLRLVGEVDLAAEPVIDSVVDALMAGDGDEEIDMSGLRFIDVRGLARLDGLTKALQDASRRVRVKGAPTGVRRCCEVLQLRELTDALERS
jgi:ABC-type transporter Mla MlaB component